MHCINSFHLFSHMSNNWLYLCISTFTMPSICWRSWLGIAEELPGKFKLGGMGGSFAFIEFIRCSPLLINGCATLSSKSLLASCSCSRSPVSMILLPSRWVSSCCSNSSNLSFKVAASSDSSSISCNWQKWRLRSSAEISKSWNSLVCHPNYIPVNTWIRCDDSLAKKNCRNNWRNISESQSEIKSLAAAWMLQPLSNKNSMWTWPWNQLLT